MAKSLDSKKVTIELGEEEIDEEENADSEIDEVDEDEDEDEDNDEEENGNDDEDVEEVDDENDNEQEEADTTNNKTLEKIIKADTFSNEKNNSLTESIKNIHETRKPIQNMESLFCENILQREVLVDFRRVGNDIEDVLLNKLRNIEGKCCTEGYIRPKSIELLTYSSGICTNMYVKFMVTFKCLVCLPVTNTIIRVNALNKTKAGIRAESRDPVSPIDVFVTRDHNIHYESYNRINVGDTFSVKIIGHRFELNDTKISIIADIFESHKSVLNYIEE